MPDPTVTVRVSPHRTVLVRDADGQTIGGAGPCVEGWGYWCRETRGRRVRAGSRATALRRLASALGVQVEVLGCEATTVCLLCGGDGCDYCTDARPDWLGRCTPTQEREALRGRHPLGWDLHPAPPEGARCGTCAHLVRRVSPGGRVNLKCGLLPMTKGPATDTRARWPACEGYREAP